jgi:CheY-like chemotaxis protein
MADAERKAFGDAFDALLDSTAADPALKLGARMSMDELRGDELAGVRVLVVDDEPETLELVSLTLRSAGADVTEASGAEMALEHLETMDPHVVLSDLQMPGIDGYALATSLRQRPAPPVAVALSASNSIEDARRALAAGFSVHVTKPIGVSELVDTIRAVAPLNPV